MTRIEKSIEINAPVEQVFQFAANWQNWTKFFEEVSDFRPVTEITRGDGARYAYKAKMLGMKAAVETEIRDFVENEGWIGVSKRGMEHKTQWIFAQADNKTKFTYILNYHLPLPIIGHIFDKLFVKASWERIIENSLQNRRRLMEK